MVIVWIYASDHVTRTFSGHQPMALTVLLAELGARATRNGSIS